MRYAPPESRRAEEQERPDAWVRPSPSEPSRRSGTEAKTAARARRSRPGSRARSSTGRGSSPAAARRVASGSMQPDADRDPHHRLPRHRGRRVGAAASPAACAWRRSRRHSAAASRNRPRIPTQPSPMRPRSDGRRPSAPARRGGAAPPRGHRHDREGQRRAEQRARHAHATPTSTSAQTRRPSPSSTIEAPTGAYARSPWSARAAGDGIHRTPVGRIAAAPHGLVADRHDLLPGGWTPPSPRRARRARGASTRAAARTASRWPSWSSAASRAAATWTDWPATSRMRNAEMSAASVRARRAEQAREHDGRPAGSRC